LDADSVSSLTTVLANLPPYAENLSIVEANYHALLQANDIASKYLNYSVTVHGSTVSFHNSLGQQLLQVTLQALSPQSVQQLVETTTLAPVTFYAQ
jgi:hypothetical protein